MKELTLGKQITIGWTIPSVIITIILGYGMAEGFNEKFFWFMIYGSVYIGLFDALLLYTDRRLEKEKQKRWQSYT